MPRQIGKIGQKVINALTEQVKISAISDNPSSICTREAKTEHVEKLANFNVPS